MLLILLKATALDVVTAVAEITCCYLVFRWLRHGDLLALDHRGGHRPTATDLVGVGVCLAGMAIIILGSRGA